MQILLNNMLFNINKKQLPWAGKVNKINATAKYTKETMQNLDGSTYVANILTFNVTCNNKSYEPGRVYTVFATMQNNNLQVEGYYC